MDFTRPFKEVESFCPKRKPAAIFWICAGLRAADAQTPVFFAATTITTATARKRSRKRWQSGWNIRSKTQKIRKVACELWVSQDQRLILYRPDGAAVVVRRAGRALDVPFGKPVVLLDKDGVEVGTKRLRVHVHGEAPAIAAPSFLPAPERIESRGGLRGAAAAVAISAAIGGAALFEVRCHPPSPVEPTPLPDETDAGAPRRRTPAPSRGSRCASSRRPWRRCLLRLRHPAGARTDRGARESARRPGELRQDRRLRQRAQAVDPTPARGPSPCSCARFSPAPSGCAGREALICGDLRLTYAGAAERVRRLADGLAGRGVGRGDRVRDPASQRPRLLRGLPCRRLARRRARAAQHAP